MATLIAKADGNLTGAATFATVDTGALALVLNRSNSNTSSAAAAHTSVTFTVTNGAIIDGVILFMRMSTASPTGTLKVALQKSGVDQASVTINKADLPQLLAAGNGTPLFYPPILFKFTTTATGDGAATWTIVFTTTGTGSIHYATATSSGTNYSRALRTTTAATPAAADDLYVLGELTGAGTKNTRTVTMDSTAATAYGSGVLNVAAASGGGIHIGNWGTLTYGTVALTNYVLRVNGDVTVWENGAFNVGSSAAGGVSYSYLNPGGTGNRTSSITATTTATVGGGNVTQLLNGTQANEFWWDTGSTGREVKFDFGSAVSINEAKWYQSSFSSHGDWKWQGSNDDSAWTDIGSSFTLGGVNTQTQTELSGNTNSWRYYRLLQVSGITANNPYLREIEFSIAAPVAIATSAVLEFQQLSADGDFGLRCLDNSVVTSTGQPRTAGKSVVKCKLTANVVGASVSTTANGYNQTGLSSIDATGNSYLASSMCDNAVNGGHAIYFSGTSLSNTTQTVTVWLARGSGSNNRYVRLTVGNNAVQASVTNGFYSDIDLQAGTAGTVTAVGNGTATSVSIAALGTGYLVKMTGKVSSGSAQSHVNLTSCSGLGTLSYTGVNGNPCFVWDHLALVTTASIADTTFNVDTDTGWLSGDVVCVASTTQTNTDCELFSLNADAGASSFTSALYPFGSSGTGASGTHHGTSPVQAEIGLLTRNVKIRSTSSTLMSYVYCAALAAVNFSWTEFQYIGTSVVGKKGIEIDGGATANAKSITYCSIHDCDVNGAFFAENGTVASINTTFSNNILWIAAMVNGGPVTSGNFTIDNNLHMRGTAGFFITDPGGTITNNTIVGAGGTAFTIQSGAVTAVRIGTFNGNTAHSSASVGLNCNSVALTGTISNFTAWRTTANGIAINNTIDNLLFTDLTLFGNTSAGGSIIMNSGYVLNINRGIIAQDSTYNTGLYAIGVTVLNDVELNLFSVDFSPSGGFYAPHTTAEFRTLTTNHSYIQGRANNCKFGAPARFDSKSAWAVPSYFSFEKYNQTAGDHRTDMTYGVVQTDTSVFNLASPSMKMTPNSASNKLESAPKNRGVLIPVDSGNAITASVYIRKDAAYGGNQPRLIVRMNPAVGITADTVLATYSAGTGSFNQISGTTVTATDSGVMEFIIDCDGTTGYIHGEDWDFVGAATTSKGMKNWFDGAPVVGGSGGGGGSGFSGGFV